MPLELPLVMSLAVDGVKTDFTFAGSGTGFNKLDETVPGASTDLAVTWTCDVSALKFLVLLASADMTVETNSASSPANTLALKANVPLFWFTDCGWACPLTTDVTGLFVTKAGAGEARLRVWPLTDATP